jgi:hypothetical protein
MALELSQAVFPYYMALDGGYAQHIGQLMSCLLFASSFCDIATSNGAIAHEHSRGGVKAGISSAEAVTAPWAFLYPHISVPGAINRACEHLIDAAVQVHPFAHLMLSLSLTL